MRVISLPSTYPVDDLKEADAIVAGLAMIKVSLDGAASGGLLRYRELIPGSARRREILLPQPFLQLNPAIGFLVAVLHDDRRVERQIPIRRRTSLHGSRSGTTTEFSGTSNGFSLVAR